MMVMLGRWVVEVIVNKILSTMLLRLYVKEYEWLRDITGENRRTTCDKKKGPIYSL